VFRCSVTGAVCSVYRCSVTGAVCIGVVLQVQCVQV